VTPTISLRRALSDPNLLGGVLAGESWSAWRTLLIALMGEELTDEERAVFRKLTGREREPLRRVEEFVGVIGRRGGKSRACSVLCCYVSALCEHELVPGERGVVLCIAPDQRQAAIVLEYCEAAFRGSPMLAQLVANRTADALELSNGIVVEVRAASYRRLRGPTYLAVIADEACFWYSDEWSSNADSEILAAIRPGLATTRGLLAIISSPYGRRGEVWNAYRRHHGPQGDPLLLVAQGASRDLNPSLPQSVVDRALERDPVSAQAEYLACFRGDVAAFVEIEQLRRCVLRGVGEVPYDRRRSYHAFCDPSGGSSDSMTVALAYNDLARQAVVVAALREVPAPFGPEAVVEEFAKLLKSYRCFSVVGDRYAGAWPVEQFHKFGVRYESSARPKSELYTDLLPLINSARIELLDHPRLLNQLANLERRTARGGRDSIDHPPGAHDDVANAVAGAASLCVMRGSHSTVGPWSGSGPDLTDVREEARRLRFLRCPAGMTVEQFERLSRCPPGPIAREVLQADPTWQAAQEAMRQERLKQIEAATKRMREIEETMK
jgi:hypothetical protein